MQKRVKPGRRYMIINVDEAYAPDVFAILKAGQMAKNEWPEGDMSFEEWVELNWPTPSAAGGGFDAALARVHEVAGTRTQVELAAKLDVRQSSISDAKRRQSIPATWLVKLVQASGINPDWILTGEGAQRLVPEEG